MISEAEYHFTLAVLNAQELIEKINYDVEDRKDLEELQVMLKESLFDLEEDELIAKHGIQKIPEESMEDFNDFCENLIAEHRLKNKEKPT